MPRIQYLTAAKDGRWKYQRDVPAALHDVLGRSRWDYSLGSDYTQAVARCSDLRRQHDREIVESLRMVAVAGEVDKKTVAAYEKAAQKSLPTVTTGVVATVTDAPAPAVELWRNSEKVLEQARSKVPEIEWQRLAMFAASAFGDGSYIARRHGAGEMLGVQIFAAVERPAAGVARQMWDAYKGLLDDRLSVLSPHIDPDDPARITAVLTKYAKAKALAPATVRTYTKRVRYFVDVYGDLRMQDITKAMLKEYRDTVAKTKEPTSVTQYLSPICAILNYAADEDLIAISPGAKLKMVKDSKSIEERKALPFTVQQVRDILKEANTRWADDAPKSKLTLERRRLYRHTLRAMLHTGTRPHELWRLEPADAGTHDQNGWVGRGLDIRDTKSGVRLIPCPAQAVAFADLVVAGGLNCLSPDGDRLPTEREVMQRVSGFSDKQFTPILVKLGIKRDRVSYMSTRPTFVTRLQKIGADDGLIQNVIGHVGTAKMLRHYKSPAEMDAMLAAMEQVVY